MKEGRGITTYIKGDTVVSVYFPAGQVCCKYCPLFLKYEKYFDRYSCALTNEWLLEPMFEPGEKCPLHFKERED